MPRGKITFSMRMVNRCYLGQHGFSRECDGELYPLKDSFSKNVSTLCEFHRHECIMTRRFMPMKILRGDEAHGKVYNAVAKWRKIPRLSEAQEKKKYNDMVDRLVLELGVKVEES